MATIQPTGFLCYNNSELIRDGFIYSSLTLIHEMEGLSSGRIRVWERRVKNGSSKNATMQSFNSSKVAILCLIKG